MKTFPLISKICGNMKILCLFMLFLNASVYAGELENCLSNSNGSQMEAGCYGEELTQLDKDVKRLVSTLSRNVSDPEYFLSEDAQKDARRRLSDSQKYWEKYRENSCFYAADLINGSGSAAYAAKCKIDLTRRRIKELKSYDPA